MTQPPPSESLAMGPVAAAVLAETARLLANVTGRCDLLRATGGTPDPDQIDTLTRDAVQALSLIRRLAVPPAARTATSLDPAAFLHTLAGDLGRVLTTPPELDPVPDLPAVTADASRLAAGLARLVMVGSTPLTLAATGAENGVQITLRGLTRVPPATLTAIREQLDDDIDLAVTDDAVVLTLPAAPTPARPEPDSGTARILLVEDDLSVRRFAARSLTRQGWQVTDVDDGETALARVNAGLTPDLLITDLNLPGLSGADLITMVRQRWPDLPILCISGYTEPAAEAGLAGREDLRFLPKPFGLDALCAAAGEMLAG